MGGWGLVVEGKTSWPQLSFAELWGQLADRRGHGVDRELHAQRPSLLGQWGVACNSELCMQRCWTQNWKQSACTLRCCWFVVQGSIIHLHPQPPPPCSLLHERWVVGGCESGLLARLAFCKFKSWVACASGFNPIDHVPTHDANLLASMCCTHDHGVDRCEEVFTPPHHQRFEFLLFCSLFTFRQGSSRAKCIKMWFKLILSKLVIPTFYSVKLTFSKLTQFGACSKCCQYC